MSTRVFSFAADENAPISPSGNRKSSLRLSFAKMPSFKIDSGVTLQQWLVGEDTTKHQARVMDPLTLLVGSRRNATPKMMLSRTALVYRVSLDDQPPVERTFKDFSSLRDMLLKRFPGSCPPPLPPTSKGVIGITVPREAFMRKRLRLLGLFLQAVTDNPFYRNDDALQQFFASALEYDVSRLGPSSLGRARWNQALQDAPRPKDSMAMIQVIRSEMEGARQRLESVKAAGKQEVTALSTLSQCKSDLSAAVGDWLALEKALTTPFAGTIAVDVFEGQRDMQVGVGDSMEPFRVRTADHALYLQSVEDSLEQALLNAVRFDQDYLMAYSAQLEEATRLLQKHKRANEIMQDAENYFERNKTATAAQRVKETQAEAASMRELVDVIEKGLLSFELLRFRQGRVLRALQTNDDMRCLQLDAATAIKALWEDEQQQSAQTSTTPKRPLAVATPSQTPRNPAPTAEQTKVLEAAQSVLALVEKREAQLKESMVPSTELAKAERTLKEMRDGRWATVAAIGVAQGTFALMLLVHGDVLLSLTAWTCLGLVVVIAKGIDDVYSP